MLNSLDQWATSFLLAVNIFMGISSIPVEKSDSWDIGVGWVSVDGYKVLNMKSKDVGDICTDNGGGFYVFPQVYMGQMTVFVDGKAVYTNSMSKKWNLFSMLSRPVVNCELLRGDEVVYRAYSYNSYFATTQTYPYHSKKMPVSQIFYEEMFFISALVAFVIGIVSLLIMSTASMLEEGITLFIFQFSLGLMAMCQIIGRFLDLHLGVTHTLIVSASISSILTFILFTVRPNLKGVYYVLWVLCLLSFTFIYLSPYSNLVSFLILVFLIPIASILSLLMFIYKYRTFKSDNDVVSLILHGIFFLIITIDSVTSQYIRESFFHISLLVMFGSLITFYRIFDMYHKQVKNNLTLKHRLDGEYQKFKTISESLLYLKEIVHDIKSPIMGISFFLTNPVLYKDQLVLVSSSIKNIIDRVSMDNLKKNMDWYSIDFIYNKIDEVVSSKVISTGRNIHVGVKVNHDIEVYIDPLDFLIVIEELIVNALKYGEGIIKISINLSDEFSIVVENQCAENAIEDHWSYGAGIINSKKKISSMGGMLSVINSAETFIASVVVKHRRFDF